MHTPTSILEAPVSAASSAPSSAEPAEVSGPEWLIAPPRIRICRPSGTPLELADEMCPGVARACPDGPGSLRMHLALLNNGEKLDVL